MNERSVLWVEADRRQDVRQMLCHTRSVERRRRRQTRKCVRPLIRWRDGRVAVRTGKGALKIAVGGKSLLLVTIIGSTRETATLKYPVFQFSAINFVSPSRTRA